jgi:hypothetical protein
MKEADWAEPRGRIENELETFLSLRVEKLNKALASSDEQLPTLRFSGLRAFGD